jgi:hypothetical protein
VAVVARARGGNLAVGIYTALIPVILRQERGKHPAPLAVGKLLIGRTSSTKAAPLHSPHSNPFIFLHTRQSWAGSLMALTAPAPHLRSLDFVRWRREELGRQGSRANEGRRHAVQWRRRGIQRTTTAMRTCRIGSDTVTTGWRVHRGYFALRLGLRRHRPLYRPVRCWSRMVRTTDMKETRKRDMRETNAETRNTGESSLPEPRSSVVVSRRHESAPRT